MSFYGKRYYDYNGNIWRGFHLGNMDKENYTFPIDEEVPNDPEEILFFPTVDYDEGTICTGNHWLQIKRGEKTNSIEIWHAKPGPDDGENNSLKEINKDVDEGTISELESSGHVISPHDTITFTVFHYDAAGHVSSTGEETYWMDDKRIVALEEYREALNIDVGDDTHIIYWQQGMPVASVGTVGTDIKPVYLSEGVITESAGNVGDSLHFVYLRDGEITASDANLGDEGTLLYLVDGVLTASTGNIGDENTPVYMKNGKLVPMDFTVTEGEGALLMEWKDGSWEPSTASVGASDRPVFLSIGRIVSSTANIGSETSFIYMKDGQLLPSQFTTGDGSQLFYFENGELKQSELTIGSPDQLMYLQDGVFTASDANLGSENKFVYVQDGTITPSTLTAGNPNQFIYFQDGEITPSTATIGSGTKPMYMEDGVMKEFTYTIGNIYQPVYVNQGNITAITGTVGDTNTPIYLNKGRFTAVAFTFDTKGGTGLLDKDGEGKIIPSTANVGANDQFIYLKNGQLIACSGDLGNDTHPLYIKNGKLVATGISITEGTVKGENDTVGGPTQFTWLDENVIRASTATVGSPQMPVYLKDGILTVCDDLNLHGDYLPLVGGTLTGDLFIQAADLEVDGDITGNRVFGAVWNDYAEYRNVEELAGPGRVVAETRHGYMQLTTQRLEPAAAIISDTYGCAIGKTNDAKTPIAIAGRVLAYPAEDKYEYELGDAVCSGPAGTVSKMTREEIIQYPDRILGIVSEIPDYETWGENNIPVNNRIWIRIK